MPSAAPPAPSVPPPDPIQIQRLTPIVEVWRAGALSPQVPIRHGRYLEPAYVGVNELVTVRLQFDPLASGKAVVLRTGRGVTLESGIEILRIDLTGQCLVSLRLGESWPQSAINFYCEGLTTTLPLARTSLSALPTSANKDKENRR